MSSITSPSAAATLTAATPASRNRVVDATRAVAMLAVVVGHWLVALPTVGADGSIGGINAIERFHSFQYLTWIFQVMPLVFVVGGFANAASLAMARARDGRDGDWVAGRLRRLLKPTIVFACFWGELRLIAGALGWSPPRRMWRRFHFGFLRSTSWWWRCNRSSIVCGKVIG